VKASNEPPSVQKANPISFMPNGVIITSDVQAFKPFEFLLDKGGNILKKVHESEPKEALLPANGSVVLHLSRPGYHAEMLLIRLEKPSRNNQVEQKTISRIV
jgi:hypothetical protein